MNDNHNLYVKKPIAYACYNKNATVRSNSSSGGAFYSLAEYMIKNNGVVFGAQFDNSWEVSHTFIDNIADIKCLMGSKYSQSQLGDTFRKVKDFLTDDKLVLFSGTPCQVNGLKGFLGTDYNNLITVDFICHGVPSRDVWRRYISEKKSKDSISSVNFRDKTEGWEKYSLKIKFKSKKEYRRTRREDYYIRGFLANIYLRPSCYECRFKGVTRDSDITLADFWGIKDTYPEFYNRLGVSAVLIQTDKGNEFFKSIENDLEYCKVKLSDLEKANKSINCSAEKNSKRQSFFENENSSISKKIAKYADITLRQKIKYFIKAEIRKIKG